MPHSSRKGLLVLLYLGLIACLGTFSSPAVAAPPGPAAIMTILAHFVRWAA
jgi:hypothetical protein